MIRLVASDVDGTLLPSGRTAVSRQGLDAVARLIGQGVWFAAASGRPCWDLQRLFAPVAHEAIFIGLDGALAFYRGRVLEGTPLDFAGAMDFARFCLAGRCQGLVLHQRSTSRRLGTVEGGGRFQEAGSLPEVEGPIYKISLYRPQGVENWLDPSLFSVCYREHGWLEVVAPGVNKGKALRRVQELTSVSRRETVALGDNDNDLELLRAAGAAVVMKQGKDSLRKEFALQTGDAVLFLQRLAEENEKYI